MTRDEIMQLDDDALRVEVAKRCGYRWYQIGSDAWITKNSGLLPKGVEPVDNPEPGSIRYFRCHDYPHNTSAALALLDGMTYPPEEDGRRVSVEYSILKVTYNHTGNIDPLEVSYYIVDILSRNSTRGDDYEATAATLPRAACEAWLAWDDARAKP